MLRNMTGEKYMRLLWFSWVLGVICAILILLTMSVTVGIVLGVFLVLSAWTNVSTGRRVAKRIDEKRRGG